MLVKEMNYCSLRTNIKSPKVANQAKYKVSFIRYLSHCSTWDIKKAVHEDSFSNKLVLKSSLRASL